MRSTAWSAASAAESTTPTRKTADTSSLSLWIDPLTFPHEYRVPSVMDVLLLSPRQLDPPLVSWADQPTMLGLVVGVSFTSGARLLQVKVNSKRWFAIRLQSRFVSSANPSSSSGSGRLLSNNATQTFGTVAGHTNGSEA